MKISANGKYQQATYAKDFSCFDFFESSGLLRIVRKSDHCPAVFKNGHRSNENFISCQFLFMDIDGGMSIADFLAHPDFSGKFLIIMTSKSHQIEKVKKNGSIEPACDRFHVLFPIAEISTRKELTDKISAMAEKYPFMDNSAKDAARFWNGFAGTEIIWQDGTEYQPPKKPDFIDDIPYTQEATKQPESNASKWNGYKDDKRGKILSTLRRCADAGMFNSDIEWVKLGMALFVDGYTERDWIALSYPDVGQSDTSARWKSFDNKVTEITGGTLLFYCRQIDPDFLVAKKDRVKVKIAPIKKTAIREIDINVAMPIDEWNWAHCDIKYETDGDGEKTDIIKSFKVRPTLENFARLMNWYGVDLRENLMAHKPETTVPTVEKTGNYENSAIGVIKHLCILNGLPAQQVLDSYITKIANTERYHPVKNWIDGIEWDGVSRLPDLYSTITVAPGYSETFKNVLVKKWFLSCIAAIYEPEYRGRGLLTIQGDQSIGKSSWLMSFFPYHLKCFKDGLTLDPRSKDSISIAISHWVCELGELEGTFKRADIAALKAFVTNTCDTIRMPYAHREETYPRRTIFSASVNSAIFLGDQTGTSRFWVIAATALNYAHDIDIGQLWAELYNIYALSKVDEDAHIWWLSPHEESMLADSNQHHTEMDEFDEIFQTAFDGESTGRPNHWTITEALKEIGYEKPTRFQINKLRDIVAKFGLRKTIVRGKTGFYFPDVNRNFIEKDHKY